MASKERRSNVQITESSVPDALWLSRELEVTTCVYEAMKTPSMVAEQRGLAGSQGPGPREPRSQLCPGLALARDLGKSYSFSGPQFHLLTNDCKNPILPPKACRDAEVGN